MHSLTRGYLRGWPAQKLAIRLLLATVFVTATFMAAAAASLSPIRPNILFCIADDASYPDLGAYGCDWVRTPGFDRLAREGLLFTRAYTPNAKCAPSRSCILTGRNSWQLEAAANHVPHFPQKFKTYAEALAENGYWVGMTAKGWAPGDPGKINGKRRQLAGIPFNARKAKPPTKGISGNDYAGNFQDFLDASPSGQPWCFWYGALEPHRAYEYGSGAAKGGKNIEDLPSVPGYWPDNGVTRNDLLDYAFEIEHFDQHLERMLDLLEQRGLLENTLIVATADNGMPFPRVKGQAYERSNHLPLVIMWKRGIQNPGRVIRDYVSFIDFAPTFLEVAGVEWDAAGMQPTPGISLTDIFSSTQLGQVCPDRDHVLIGKERHDIGRPHDWGYPIRGIVKGNTLYLRNYEITRWPAGDPETGYLNCDGSPTKTEVLNGRRDGSALEYWEWCFGRRVGEELFYLENDPLCLNNLADNPAFTKLKESLRDQMERELKEQGDPRLFGNGGVFEAYPYSDPKTQGFYERYLSGESLNAGWVNDSDFEDAPLD